MSLGDSRQAEPRPAPYLQSRKGYTKPPEKEPRVSRTQPRAWAPGQMENCGTSSSPAPVNGSEDR